MKFNYGQFGCTGIIYDGVDVSDAFTVVDVSVPVLPSIEAVTQELAQRPGQYFASRKVGTREVKLKLALDAESRCPVDIFKAWRDVSGVFNKPDPRRLYMGEGKFINALFVGESEIEDQGCKGVCELTFVCFAPFFYGERHDVALSGSTAFKVRGGVGAVSYTHLDVYKRQVYPDAVAAPVVTKGFPKNEQPFYVAVDEIVTDAQPGKGASTGQAEMEFSANVWVCARHADLVKAANTAMSYADAVIALSLIHI